MEQSGSNSSVTPYLHQPDGENYVTFITLVMTIWLLFFALTMKLTSTFIAMEMMITTGSHG